ncbi:hypothetical protein CGK31_23025 [Vibrio parahaemolyticus]|nr:hypothetical protein CGK31_23025 [Vibrio parahaemolyticus]
MFTAQWFSLGGMRCSPLNAALAANEKVSAKAECLGLMAHVLFARFCAANFGILVCRLRSSRVC